MRMWLKPKLILVVVVAVVGTTGVTTGVTDEVPGRVVIAEFRDASTILEGSDVKMHGVTVGTTGKPTLDRARKVAMVPLRLDSSAFPLHKDASAKIAPLTLLGERYVDLDRGTPTQPPMRPGKRIPPSRTSVPVHLQDVVNELDDPTASSLAALVVTLGQGASGNGKNIQKTLRALGPAMHNTDTLAQVLKQQNNLLGGVVDRVTPVASALAADDGNRLDSLVSSTERLLGAAASRDQQMVGTLRELPATLRQASQTLSELTGTSETTTEVLANVRPTTDNLSEISKELIRFADSADPALASADPVLERANELLDQARPVVQELRNAGPGLRRSAKGARPIVTELNHNLGNVLSFIRYWALATNGRDGLSHYFRAEFVVSPDMVSGWLPGGTKNGAPAPRDREKPRKRKNEPTYGENQLPLPRGLLDPTTEEGSATGLGREQEKAALGFLLGGQ